MFSDRGYFFILCTIFLLRLTPQLSTSTPCGVFSVCGTTSLVPVVDMWPHWFLCRHKFCCKTLHVKLGGGLGGVKTRESLLVPLLPLLSHTTTDLKNCEA